MKKFIKPYDRFDLTIIAFYIVLVGIIQPDILYTILITALVSLILISKRLYIVFRGGEVEDKESKEQRRKRHNRKYR